MLTRRVKGSKYAPLMVPGNTTWRKMNETLSLIKSTFIIVYRSDIYLSNNFIRWQLPDMASAMQTEQY